MASVMRARRAAGRSRRPPVQDEPRLAPPARPPPSVRPVAGHRHTRRTQLACLASAGLPAYVLTLDRAAVFPASKDRPVLFGGEFYGLPILTPGSFLGRERAAGRLRGP